MTIRTRSFRVNYGWIVLLLLGAALGKAQITTTTTLTSVTPAAPQFGQLVTLTATVQPTAATGSLSFMDGGVLVGVGTLASGSAQLQTLTLPAGPHALKAVYGGVVGAYQASQSTVQPYVVTALAGNGFSAAGPFTVGGSPYSVALGDFNGDGKADMAIANAGSNTVTVFLGNGSGGFSQAAGSPFTVGLCPQSVAVGDFNADGKLDLVTANECGASVTVLLGNGSGGFTPASGSPFGVGSEPTAVMVADFNGDGRADLATVNFGGSNVTVLLGNGSGGFSQTSGSPFAVGSQPYRIAVADFNGDGIADMAVPSYGSGNVAVLLGNGSGGFSPASGSPFAVGVNPYFVTAADFNGDGKPDMAVTNSGGNSVTVLLGNGSGGFSPASGSPVPVGSSPNALAAGDFNGDGRTDLAVANGTGNSVTVLLGNGAGGFSPASGSPFAVGTGPGSVAAGDFNGDGRADLAVVNETSANVSVLLATVPPTSSTNLLSGPNPSQFGQSVTLTASVTPSTATGPVEFLDGTTPLGVGTLSSGSTHIITPLLPSGSNALRALYNGSPGVEQPSESAPTSQTMNPVAGLGFAPAVTYPAQQGEPEYLVVGDFNLDGKPDVAIADNSGWISVFLGNGNGTFQPVANYLSGGGASTLAVGDFNGDGKPDLAVGGVSSTAISILPGNGNGTFQTAVAYPAGLSANSISVADFNGDGWVDVVAGATNGGGNVSIMLGNGDGTLRAPLVFGPSAGLGVYGLAVGDFNGDGKPDLVGAQFGGSNLSLFLGNGDGTLQPAVSIPVGSKPLYVVVGDFNGDGIADLAAVNSNSGSLSVLLGIGNGTFQTPVNYTVGSTPYSVAIGDFDADGKQDLAVGYYGTTSAFNFVSVLLGNGNGTFQPAVSYSGGGTAPLSVAVADLNGDGRADLVFSNYNSNNIGVLLATPAPIISSISPSTVSAGETFTLTVNGSNFLSTSVPYWNTAPNVGPLPNVQFGGSTLLTATVPASYILAAGSYPISVSTGGVLTSSLPLTVVSETACGYALSSPSTTIPSTAGPYSVSLTTSCPYSTVSNSPWITITSGGSGTGSGTIGYSVSANTSGSQRVGSISVLDGDGDQAAVFTITEQTPPCASMSITSGSFTFGQAATNGAVTLSSGCPWSAVSSNPTWLTLPAASGTGSSIAFNVAANGTGAQRSATLTVTNTTTGGLFPAINVVQNSQVCTYSIADATSGATSNGFSSSVGSGSINVTAPAGCGWIATTPGGSFVSITGSASGSGNGSVSYSIPTSTAARSSSITITGQVTGQSYTGQVYTITQASPATTASCVANAGVPPTVRAEGVTERVGDIVITCATGSAPAPGIVGDVTVYFSSNGANVAPSNQLIGSGSYTDALLLLNEPTTPVLNTNAFRGEVTPVPALAGRPAGYVMLFPAVQLTPTAGGSFSNLTFRITNMRLNVSAAGVSTSITATISMPPPFATGSFTTQTVASIAQGLPGENTPVSMGLASQTAANFTVNFAEGFANDFRPRLATGQNPSAPGTVYNAESGFVNSAALGTQTGFATTGTRLLATITNVPTGVTLYAPVAPVSGSNAGLVAADSTGNGGTFVPGSLVNGVLSQAISITGGTGFATWEVTGSNPALIETFGFNLYISNPGGANLANMKYAISFAPAIGLGGTSATAPIPRFPTAGTQPALGSLNLAPTAGSLAGSLLAISHLGNAAAIQKALALAASSTIEASSTIGGSVTVSELVANASGNPASNVVVGGSLPTSWTVAGCYAPDANGSCTMSGNQFTVTYPALSPGQTGTIIFTGQTPLTGLSTLSFNSIVSSDASNGSSLGSFTVTFPVPAFTIQKTHASNFTQGQTGAQYSISVVNSATTSTSGQVTVTDTLPSGLTLTGMSDGGAGVWTCIVGTATCTTSQSLAPTLGYPPITVTVNVAAAAPANVINTASVSGGGSQGPATALDSTNINPSCSYQLNATSANPGAGASTGSVNVIALYGCQWTAVSNASWLTVTSGSPGNGNGTVNYAVAANPGPGGRSGTLTIGGQTFTVSQAPVTMSLSQTTLNFASGGGMITGQQTVTVSFSGSARVAWTASSSQPNVTVSSASGTGLGMLTITASAGPSATITVTAPGASNSPLAIQANVATVTPGIPFGSFDTPSNGATGVSGSIAVTGWALDSIAVTGVDVWREPVAGESGTALVFIGNATFVVGARTDVQALYPTTPFNYQAGWGYLLLTNELPNNGSPAGIGNGTYKLHAIAHNKSGMSLDLGTKTITVNNAAATLPFGAIDTPGQGATVSGTVTNFGWALTPPTVGCPAADQPCKIPVNGSTIFVFVDGISLGNPVYNLARSDVDAAFPGYANSGSLSTPDGGSPGPVGYFNLDTTQLINGVHTIAWSVTDNAGKAQGIGSRYFTVEN